MEPVIPLIWSLALSGQFQFNPQGLWIVPGGSLRIERSGQSIQWSQMGERSSLAWNGKHHGLLTGRTSFGYWTNGQIQFGGWRSAFWVDWKTRLWSLEGQWMRNQWTHRLAYHPRSGMRWNGTSERYKFDVGRRWSLEMLPLGVLPRVRIAGGWNVQTPIQTDVQWRKVHLQYRSQWGSLGQFRTAWQPTSSFHASAVLSEGKWRLQSNHRYQLRNKGGRLGPYFETTVYGQNGSGGLGIGMGKGTHRFHASTAFMEWQGPQLELGIQTHGNFGKLGRYQVQGIAQRNGTWTLQVRITQGFQWNTGAQRPKIEFGKIQLGCESGGVDGHALVLLTHRETGQVVRVLIVSGERTLERLPVGRYAVRVVGPEHWEFTTDRPYVEVASDRSIENLTIYANPLIFKNMN